MESIYKQLSAMTLEQLSQKGLGEPPREMRLKSFDAEGLAKYIVSDQCKNIIVMAGAGISVSAGIPDFRTPGTGLYDNLQKYDLPDPQAIFDIGYFNEKPNAFYLLAREMWAEGVAAGKYRPTPTHHFLKLLHDKGLLLRCFTQNIDSLEAETGLPKEKIIAAHGNFDGATCIKTGAKVPVEEMKRAIIVGEEGEEGWAALRDKYGGLCKPDIVFFGESLPPAFFRGMKEDFPQCDLLLVLGTSLTVHPFASLVDRVDDDTPRCLINRDPVGMRDPKVPAKVGTCTLQVGPDPQNTIDIGTGFRFESGELNYRDVGLLGDCDTQCRLLAEKLGWKDDLEALVAAQDAAPLDNMAALSDALPSE